MFKSFIVVFFALFALFFTACENKLGKTKLEKLQECSDFILKKNLSMMESNTIGKWKDLEDIKVFPKDDGIIYIEYYSKHLLTVSQKDELDEIQKKYLKNQNCKDFKIESLQKR